MGERPAHHLLQVVGVPRRARLEHLHQAARRQAVAEEGGDERGGRVAVERGELEVDDLAVAAQGVEQLTGGRMRVRRIAPAERERPGQIAGVAHEHVEHLAAVGVGEVGVVDDHQQRPPLGDVAHQPEGGLHHREHVGRAASGAAVGGGERGHQGDERVAGAAHLGARRAAPPDEAAEEVGERGVGMPPQVRGATRDHRRAAAPRPLLEGLEQPGLADPVGTAHHRDPKPALGAARHLPPELLELGLAGDERGVTMSTGHGENHPTGAAVFPWALSTRPWP